MIMKIISMLSQDKMFSYDDLSISLETSIEVLKGKMLELENMGFVIKVFLKDSSCSPSACCGCASGECNYVPKQPAGLEDKDFFWELTDQARSSI